ncbi:MAG: hypothetical protein U9R03_03655 [Candidatus Aerophobetes bacterium]|nr:hypothetical protein [Candidatus Aerophobetes bacterium]
MKRERERKRVMLMIDFEIIKDLAYYRQHPANFFYERLPEYIEENGRFIQVKRAFHEILNYPVGIHAGRYQERIFGIHIMALTNALRQLRKEEKVEMRSQGVWVWVENDGKNGR